MKDGPALLAVAHGEPARSSRLDQGSVVSNDRPVPQSDGEPTESAGVPIQIDRLNTDARSPDTSARGGQPRRALGLEVAWRPRWLVARFSQGRDHVAASWAIVGGGIRRARLVVWHEVSDVELRPPVDAAQLLSARLRGAGYGGAVGLLTSRRLDTYVDVARSAGGIAARCVATVGLGNALRAGDPPGPSGRIGTINLLCLVSVVLGRESLLEALALAAEARALAVREAGVASTVSGQPASGTGTDCIVVAAPDGRTPVRYAGKHTVVGHVIGAAVRDAVAQGVQGWMRERGGSDDHERVGDRP